MLKTGDLVKVSNDGKNWSIKIFLVHYDGIDYCKPRNLNIPQYFKYCEKADPLYRIVNSGELKHSEDEILQPDGSWKYITDFNPSDRYKNTDVVRRLIKYYEE